MSLATRCPACGTVFRVVSDQLKVSEGWVRCGRCTEVFNAAQRLFELEQQAAARPLGATAEPEAQPAVDPEPAHALAKTVSEPAPPADSARSADASAPTPTPTPATTTAAAVATAATTAPEVAPDAATSAAAEAPPEAADAAPTPGFVRRAERAARWRHPARSGPLAAAALLLLALLGAQIALHFRDRVAAAWPDTLPWLQAGCSLLGCRVEAPRRIDSLNVDSSGLVRMPDSPLYRLSLVVQNKAATVVRMPAIDLALTDGQGQTMARRVLSAAELGHPDPSLPPGGEITLQATLDLGERQLAGYTVELFYP